MTGNTFFVCPNCGNDKEFRVFTSSFRDIKQSPELGMRIEESDFLPNLRGVDAYIECKFCSQRFECDNTAAIGKKYIKTAQRLRKTKHNAQRPDTRYVDGK